MQASLPLEKLQCREIPQGNDRHLPVTLPLLQKNNITVKGRVLLSLYWPLFNGFLRGGEFCTHIQSLDPSCDLTISDIVLCLLCWHTLGVDLKLVSGSCCSLHKRGRLYPEPGSQPVYPCSACTAGSHRYTPNSLSRYNCCGHYYDYGAMVLCSLWTLSPAWCLCHTWHKRHWALLPDSITSVGFGSLMLFPSTQRQWAHSLVSFKIT